MTELRDLAGGDVVGLVGLSDGVSRVDHSDEEFTLGWAGNPDTGGNGCSAPGLNFFSNRLRQDQRVGAIENRIRRDVEFNREVTPAFGGAGVGYF